MEKRDLPQRAKNYKTGTKLLMTPHSWQAPTAGRVPDVSSLHSTLGPFFSVTPQLAAGALPGPV